MLWQVSFMSAAGWNITGLIMVLFGVLFLFRYGMPYRVRTGGANYYVAEQNDPIEQKQERIYAVLGWIGIILVIAGTLCQIKASLG